MSDDVDRTDEYADLDADEARALTDEIRHDFHRVWDKIITAYHGRAWIALNYPSWDDYCHTEFATIQLRLPREERRAVVVSLNESGFSTRAIASAIGTSQDTVNRDLRERNRSPEPVDVDTLAEELITTELAPVIGLDGKTYAAKPKPQPDTRKPKPSNTFNTRFYRHLSQLQSHAQSLKILTQKEEFAAHVDELRHQHLEGVIWAHEILTELLAQLSSNQEALFGTDEGTA